jgi:hypothetical protein
MKRLACTFLMFLALVSCTDDQVMLERGPLGPAAYEVVVTARGRSTELDEHRAATLRIVPRPRGADFALRPETGGLITASMRRSSDGSVNLERVHGTPVDRPRQAELASLVGQLDPPLPKEPVRIGERWSSGQRIRTTALRATLRTALGIARFRRIASTDTALLEGTISGRLTTSGDAGVLTGTLRGRTSIAWAVQAGRVVAADTKLVWTLSSGDRITLETRVSPR